MAQLIYKNKTELKWVCDFVFKLLNYTVIQRMKKWPMKTEALVQPQLPERSLLQIHSEKQNISQVSSQVSSQSVPLLQQDTPLTTGQLK